MITMAGSAHDFVSWYEQALRGAFFTNPETLTEFKRIQAMSVQIPATVSARHCGLMPKAGSFHGLG